MAILRYIDELLPQNLAKMERHDETEVFFLLTGHCMLLISAGDQRVSAIHAQDMEPPKRYNVKKHCWHTHTLSAEATVLIVENRDTTSINSNGVET